MNSQPSADAFTIERHGEVIVIKTDPVLSWMEPTLLEGAASLLLDSLKRESCPQVVVDLSRLEYFGSTFLALLIRCWKLATLKGGTLVLAGVSSETKALLHVTSLDMVWPLYAEVREAIETLQSD